MPLLLRCVYTPSQPLYGTLAPALTFASNYVYMFGSQNSLDPDSTWDAREPSRQQGGTVSSLTPFPRLRQHIATYDGHAFPEGRRLSA